MLIMSEADLYLGQLRAQSHMYVDLNKVIKSFLMYLIL